MTEVYIKDADINDLFPKFYRQPSFGDLRTNITCYEEIEDHATVSLMENKNRKWPKRTLK